MEEVLPGAVHADKLEVVFVIKLESRIFNDERRVLPGREAVLIIPKVSLFSSGGHHWLSKDAILKAYELSR